MTEPQTDAAPHALVEAHLVAGRAYLLAYVASRVDDPSLAEDVVQDSLLRALRAAPGLRDEEKLVPWFRRIVANAIADVYRRREREVASLDRYRHERCRSRCRRTAGERGSRRGQDGLPVGLGYGSHPRRL